MTNGQNIAKAKHLEDVANGAKRYILAEILDVTQAVATELENIAVDDFTGAGLSTAGLSGLVPAPSAGEQNKFLRSDGTWATLPSSVDYVIGSRVSTVEGGLWRSSINDVPVLKLRHGDYEYNFNYDSLTYLGGESIAIANVEPDTYVIGTDSVSAEGGLWYELSDNTPTLNLHAGSFNYGFNYDSITYKGGNSHLVSYLPFDASTTADACGKTWEVDGTVSLDTEIKKFGAACLNIGETSFLQAENIIDLNSAAWTFDCWIYKPYYQGNYHVQFGADIAKGRGVGISSNNYGYKAICPNAAGTGLVEEGFVSGDNANPWAHIAMTRRDNKIYFFARGLLIHTFDVPESFDFGTTFRFTTARFDSVRFFEGVALWTENFTVPTAADYA